MQSQHLTWFSPNLEREMDLLVYGHAGARVLVFPTSHGSYHEWRDRDMIAALGEHIERGWIQVYCPDSANDYSWYAKYLSIPQRVEMHLRYERYLVDEVLPLSNHFNDNPYLITAGASFGALVAVLFGFRYPHLVSRIIGLSGFYDAARFLDYSPLQDAYFVNPLAFVSGMQDEAQRELLRRQDIILAIGRDDPSFDNNVLFSQVLSQQGIDHAFRVWEGWAHDWPYWRDMIVHYVGGPDSGQEA